MPFQKFIHDFRRLTPSERSMWRWPMMWLSTAAIVVVPSLYASINLASSLDPYGNLQALPVGVVNLDQGTERDGETINVGREVMDDFQEDPPFDLTVFPTEAAARGAVKRGDIYFALTIPADFSRKAVAADSSQHGLLKFYVAEGSNYFASRVADSFATRLSDELNKSLGETRWEAVQASLKDVQNGLRDIKDATGRLSEGAGDLKDGAQRVNDGASALQGGLDRAAEGSTRLAAGAAQVSSGVQALTGGTVRLKEGIGELNAAIPTPEKLQPLREGAAALSQGNTQLATGLGELATGAEQLAAGSGRLKEGADQVAAGNQQLAEQLPQLQSGLGELATGAGQLAAGSGRLKEGADQVAAGNQQLAEQLPQLETGVGRVVTGVDTLNTGAAELATGLTRLNEGVRGQPQLPGQLETGVAELNQGSQRLHGGTSELLQTLPQLQQGASAAAAGAQQLAEGAGQLSSGTGELNAGAERLAEGARAAQQGSEQAVTGAQQLAEGAGQLSSGAGELNTGARTLAARSNEAAAGAARLANGAGQVQSGVNDLADGVEKIGAGVGTINSQLPAQADLDRLSSGAQTLAGSSAELSDGLGQLDRGAGDLAGGTADLLDGAGQLADGLSELDSKISTEFEELGGDPSGLTRSVTVQTEKFAAVANNGTGFAPYFMALSLWVGAVLTTFVFPFQQLPYSARSTGQAARVLRKFLMPALLVIIQAVLMVFAVQALGVEYLHPAQVIATSVLASLTFFSLILALILMFGSVGRFIALVLLILQLASSGGSYPVELAPPVFQAIHNWVPVTQAVGALRHAIAGAYQGQYLTFMLVLLCMLAASGALSMLAHRRWELVDDVDFRPLIVSPLASGHVHEDDLGRRVRELRGGQAAHHGVTGREAAPAAPDVPRCD